MILKILNLALFLTVLWLLWSGVGARQGVSHVAGIQAQQERAFNTLNHRISEAEERLNKRPDELQLAAATPAKPAEVDAELISQLRLEIDDYRQRLSAVQKTAELKQAITTIIAAEFLKYNDPSQAAEQLLSTKEVIWRKSTDEEEIKQSLQSLMAPIDILADEWQQGFTDNTASTIYRILADSIAILERPAGAR